MSGLNPVFNQMFSTGMWRNTPLYQCVDCQFDCLDDYVAMSHHLNTTGHGLVKKMTPENFIQQELSQPTPTNVTVTLGYLCWNTRVISTEGCEALYEEAVRLSKLGCKTHIVVIDNGSTDGTFNSLRKVRELNMGKGGWASHTFFKYDENVGISRARNYIIDCAIANRSEYLMLMDGDIQIVPFSSYVMAKYLNCHPDVGCIGAYSSSFTTDKGDASEILVEIPESRVKRNVKCAWTQYGLFRMSMFKGGVRFDESGPFGLPGWGYEDDDLYYQIIAAGYECKYFNGMIYLHRKLHSSWDSLKALGVSPRIASEHRKAYLLSKWTKNGLRRDILGQVQAQQFPVEA